jgi:hypothetical protein
MIFEWAMLTQPSAVAGNVPSVRDFMNIPINLQPMMFNWSRSWVYQFGDNSRASRGIISCGTSRLVPGRRNISVGGDLSGGGGPDKASTAGPLYV